MMRVVYNIVKSLFGLIFSIFRPLKRLWCRRLKASEMDHGVPVVTTHSTAINMPVTLDNADGADLEMESWDVWDNNGQPQPPSPAQFSQSNPAFYQNADRPPTMVTAAANQMVRGRKPEPTDAEPEPDFFQDMVPDFKRPVKVGLPKPIICTVAEFKGLLYCQQEVNMGILLKKKDNGAVNTEFISSRLSVSEAEAPVPSELESWEESGESAWGEELAEDLSWEADAALKEKRRLERQNRTLEQQKKKQQRDAQRGLKKDSHLAVKIS